MGEVVFRCPKTGAGFESGFQAEPNELILRAGEYDDINMVPFMRWAARP
jgi:hypothetical protein